MPRLCAFGCLPSDITTHSFPNPKKFPERFKIWVNLVGGNLNTNEDYEHYKKKKVCDIHFTDSHRNRFNRLNAIAIPTLHLRGPSQVVLEQITLTETQENISSQLSRTLDPVPADSEVIESFADTYNQTCPSPSSDISHDSGASPYIPNTPDVNLEHNYTFCERSARVTVPANAHSKNIYNARMKSYQKQIRNLQSEICRLRKNTKTIKARLAVAKKSCNGCKFQQIAKNMTKPAQLFVQMQLQSGKKPKGRRYNLEEIILSLSLYKESPKSYAHLCKYFTLPSIRSLKRLGSQFMITDDINNISFETIEETCEKS